MEQKKREMCMNALIIFCEFVKKLVKRFVPLESLTLRTCPSGNGYVTTYKRR